MILSLETFPHFINKKVLVINNKHIDFLTFDCYAYPTSRPAL